MKNFRNIIAALFSLTGLLQPAHTSTEPDGPILWEIHQAFPTWVEGENWLVYTKLTNVGNEAVPLSGLPCESDVQQIRFVPKWKEGKHFHGNHAHAHHLPQMDAPWMSHLDWLGEPLTMLNENISRSLLPGQSEVLGDLEFRLLWMDNGMLDPHLESFQLAMRLGPNRYTQSKPQTLVFAEVAMLEKHPVLAEVERAGGGLTPIRQIRLGNETWLFNRSARIVRVPEGATPRWHTEDEKQVLVIEFDGVEEEPVRVDIRQSFPLSGSERTVPHLHLWRSLTKRAMNSFVGSVGGFFKETGLTLEKARQLKWDGTDPELKARAVSRISSDTTGDGGAVSSKGKVAPSQRGTEGSRVWIWVSIVLLATAGLVFLKLRREE